MVDAKHVHKRLDDKVPAGQEWINEALEQIAYADRIILNKTDLVRLAAWGMLAPAAAEQPGVVAGWHAAVPFAGSLEHASGQHLPGGVLSWLWAAQQAKEQVQPATGSETHAEHRSCCR